MYPEERVSRFVTENFVPIRIDVRNPAGQAAMERFGALWTPTIVFLDPEGVERYRFEGYLPAEEFLAQLLLGLAHVEFARKNFAEAERLFSEVAERFPKSELAPQALYWKGVSRYKASGDAAALGDTAAAFQKRYSDSSWAKKASVWAQPH